MTAPVPEVVASVESNTLRLIIEWRGQRIYFGSVRMARDGSLYFTSGFHDGSYSSTIDFGTSRFTEGKFHIGPVTSTSDAPKKTHFSLHPETQTMLLRRGHMGVTLFERKINWFPVTQPFNLIRLYSPPLGECQPMLKTSPLVMPVPDVYEGSLELVIDVFPVDTTEHNPHVTSAWINWGMSPHYKIRVTLNYTNQNLPALLLWPEDDLLIL